MYVIKGNSQYGFILISAVFVSLIFNLFLRKNYDFSYIILDLNDMANIANQKSAIIVSSILINRIKHILIILLLFKALGAVKVYNILTIFGGGLLGLTISAQLHYLGINGIVILICFLLPHYIVYYIAISYGQKFKLFDVGKESDFKNIMLVCVIFMVGVFIECLFSTFFLKNFYQYMVR